ncbi:MAG: 30S ribosomal protein S24e [Candidatus Hodarchaeaceae archaeon]|nr:30S ribosomal protein S24e [Candidatus Hodarchaeaceae archaeon]
MYGAIFTDVLGKTPQRSKPVDLANVSLINHGLKIEGVAMKVEITEKVENPLLQRTEIKFKVNHAGEPTPKRSDVRAQLAAHLSVPEELVVIEKLAGMYGRRVASGIARAYSSRERLEKIEPEYLIKRGLPAETKAEAKPEEKPKEVGKKGGRGQDN